ncbi:tail length tape measure protein [Aggregatibacter actinomycetemcomitans]|uniref:Tail length tape measure protein n=1 Tax=Aggregatibacter actinomycetemcomitans TaxID=714 RepID=A0A2G1DQK6_AGGAC|nr:tail length tape measure protein [Aggregatibacter actinomycetemcomitans]PHO20798.1 tail length tape measure protein [Aggregatibacter actinomycetemcomitans]PHO22945.1 tail length tape measure protein [Aggregatibacter actinomycetemcomitans]
MLLNELLIKIGFDADSQAMQQFEQLLNTLEQGANGAAEQLGDFAKAIEDVAKEAVEQAKEMPEFSEFFKSLDDLQEKTKDLSQDEALDAWVQKILESDELLSGFGEDFTTNAQELEQGLVSLGLSSEDVEKVIVKLKDAIEKKQKTTEDDTKSTQENTEAQKDNAESAGNLADKMIALWATKYGADGLIQKFELLGISISKTTLKFAAFGAAFYAATIGVKNFVDNNLDALNEIKQLSAVTGEAADQIYKLGKVAEVNGSSSQAVQASIEGLSRTIGEAAAGIGRGSKYFEQYGLSAKKANGDVKTSSEILGEISDKMKKMGEQEQIAMLAKLGIDGSMIQLLRLGNDELREQIELADKLTLGVGNAENAKTAAAFKDNMTQLTQVFTAMGEYLSLRIAPAISRIIERFTKWFSENNDLIKAILNGFGRVFSFLFELAGAIDNVVSNTIGWRTVIYTLGAALLWLSRRMILAFATNPIGLAIMAIAGLILIIDDFITWLQGGESAFGDFYQSVADGLQWIEDKWDELVAWIKEKWDEGIDWVKSKWNGFVDSFSIQNIKKTFEDIKQTIINKFKEAFGWAIDLWNSIVAKIGGEPINIEANITTNQKPLGNISTAPVMNVADIALNAGMYASASRTAANGAGNISNADNSVKNSNNKYQTTINIQSTGDPKKDGRIAGDEFARVVSNNQSVIVG